MYIPYFFLNIYFQLDQIPLWDYSIMPLYLLVCNFSYFFLFRAKHPYHKLRYLFRSASVQYLGHYNNALFLVGCLVLLCQLGLHTGLTINSSFSFH